MLRISTAIAIYALVVAAAFAQPITIRSGFDSGEGYLQMSQSEQRAYAIGVVNGMLLAPLFGAPKNKMLQIENCLGGMSDSQVAAILAKYLRNNPGRWHETPHAPMYTALLESCPK